jgi:hypothetical protein
MDRVRIKLSPRARRELLTYPINGNAGYVDMSCAAIICP